MYVWIKWNLKFKNWHFSWFKWLRVRKNAKPSHNHWHFWRLSCLKLDICFWSLTVRPTISSTSSYKRGPKGLWKEFGVWKWNERREVWSQIWQVYLENPLEKMTNKELFTQPLKIVFYQLTKTRLLNSSLKVESRNHSKSCFINLLTRLWAHVAKVAKFSIFWRIGTFRSFPVTHLLIFPKVW